MYIILLTGLAFWLLSMVGITLGINPPVVNLTTCAGTAAGDCVPEIPALGTTMLPSTQKVHHFHSTSNKILTPAT
jgi:hypothetical protein